MITIYMLKRARIICRNYAAPFRVGNRQNQRKEVEMKNWIRLGSIIMLVGSLFFPFIYIKDFVVEDGKITIETFTFTVLKLAINPSGGRGGDPSSLIIL